MYFHNIASGSKGNATVVVSKETVILIDMGISFVSLEEGLKEVNLTPANIDVALFTHDHRDHYNGLRFLKTKKCFALEGTLPSLCGVVKLFKPFKVKDVTITPLKTSHDATNPCGYMLEDGEEKLVYMTDTGVFLESNLSLLENPDYLIIESNHDMGMLMGSNRPMILKQRIKSDVGHLCNEDSAFAASKIIGTRTKEIVLAHLSEECNTEEHALNAYKDIFSYLNINLDLYNIKCAKQWESISGGNNEN